MQQRESSPVIHAVNVLLVEDSEADATLFSVWLEETKRQPYEFTVAVVSSMEEAIEHLAATYVDIVLLDLNLPDSFGLDTLHAIVAQPTKVPVVVLTGLDDEDVGFEAVRSGAQDFLIKSKFDERLLRRSIRYAIERFRLDQERTELSRQLLTILEDEQQRMARELHDEIGQSLSGINLLFRSHTRKLRQHGFEDASKTAMISDSIQNILDSFRRILSGLDPVDVDTQGLGVALQHLCDDIQARTDEFICLFDCEDGLSVADNKVATNLYRIAQEAVNNACKHAGAKTIAVKICHIDGDLVLQVSDDGIGFPSNRKGSGMGLRIQRYRSELIGAQLGISSSETGTTVECRVPVGNTTSEKNA